MSTADRPNNTPRGRRRKEERKCPFCPQVFFKTEHLARHVRIHTREKPFQCNVCHKSYTRHDTLLRHARSHTESQGSSSATSTPQVHAHVSFQQSPANRASISGIGPDALALNEQVQAVHETPRFSISDPEQSMSLNTVTDTTQSLYAQSSTGHSSLATSSAEFPADPLPLALDHLNESALQGDMAHIYNDADMWDFSYDLNWPSWSVGTDFDLQAMNASIAATITQYPEPAHALYTGDLPATEAEASLSPQIQSRNRGIDALHRSWFLHGDSDLHMHSAHGTITPMNEHENNERADVDEEYRSSLSRRLQQRPYDNSLPSTEFLNLCVQLYFARFHPVFPVVHAPTFRPSMAKSLLVLSVCSIGSLFIGSPSATAQGIRIFETLNKSILNSWERYMNRSSTEVLSMVQASLIGQTFGMLSGLPNHLTLVEAFHGTVIALARHGKMFKESRSRPSVKEVLGDRDALDKEWKSWIHSEQMSRVVLGLHVHDAELAVMFHHDPLLRHYTGAKLSGSSERLFNAGTASQWAALVLDEPQRPLHDRDVAMSGLNSAASPTPTQSFRSMTDYALLEGICSAICESRQLGRLDAARQVGFTNDLIAWKNRWHTVPKDRSADPFCLMILWHSTFITLFADFDKIERAIGRDGSLAAMQMESHMLEWASSRSAKRCVVHASLLRKQVEIMHIGSEPAIHVPQSLFRAAVVWYSYVHFAPPTSSDDVVDSNHNAQHPSSRDHSINFPEIQHLGSSILSLQSLFKTSGSGVSRSGNPSATESGTLCALRDLLQRLGHWGLSRRFATLVGILIDGEAPDLGR